jgi:homoserine kinase type II
MAVYTHINDEELRAFLKNYDLGDFICLTPITSGIENTNYFLDMQTGRYVLTIFEKRVNPDDLPYFLGFSDHLFQNGIACPQPIRRCDGQIISDILGKKSTIISFLSGQSRMNPTPSDCANAGEFFAKMHLAQSDFKQTRPNNLGLMDWRFLCDKIGDKADIFHAGLKNMLHQELTFLTEHLPNHLPTGNIHADLFTDNVFFNDAGQVSGVIDFYFSCTDTLIYDLAICINAWCFDEMGVCDSEKIISLLDSYQKIRILSDEEKKFFAVFLRGASVRFLLTRLHDWFIDNISAVVEPKNPQQYLNILKYHQSSTETYF